MHPPTKDQTSIGVDEPVVDAANDAPFWLPNGELIINKDMARQEFAKEADINYMLSKFNIVPERGAPIYGEWDDSMDLQQAISSVTEARAAYAQLPDALKGKFGSMEELLHAYNNGQLKIVDGEAPIPPKTETELLQDRINNLEERLASRPA